MILGCWEVDGGYAADGVNYDANDDVDDDDDDGDDDDDDDDDYDGDADADVQAHDDAVYVCRRDDGTVVPPEGAKMLEMVLMIVTVRAPVPLALMVVAMPS